VLSRLLTAVRRRRATARLSAAAVADFPPAHVAACDSPRSHPWAVRSCRTPLALSRRSSQLLATRALLLLKKMKTIYDLINIRSQLMELRITGVGDPTKGRPPVSHSR